MRQELQDPYPDTEESRTRHKVVVAIAITAAVTAVLVAVGIVLLAGSGSGSSKTAGAASGAPSPTTVLDSHAKIACQKLARAEQRRKGGAPFDKTQAGIDEFSAQTEAAGSTIAALAEIAKRDDGSPEVIAELRMWCAANGG